MKERCWQKKELAGKKIDRGRILYKKKEDVKKIPFFLHLHMHQVRAGFSFYI